MAGVADRDRDDTDRYGRFLRYVWTRRDIRQPATVTQVERLKGRLSIGLSGVVDSAPVRRGRRGSGAKVAENC